MSTTTTTTSARPATSSLAASSKFATFAITFAIVGPVLYLICLFWNLPLVTYHPAVNRLDLGWTAARSGEGPAMYWYGWTLTVALVGGILSFLATLLPESAARKLPLALVWVLPVLTIPFFIYSLKDFWFHP
jgi:hypothetical protein